METVLMIATMIGAEQCGHELARELNLTVSLATSRRAALAAVRRDEYSVIVVEQSLIESDATWADLLWQNAGFALPVQLNLVSAGPARVIREVRAVLQRREREMEIARRVATTALQNELKSSVTGLLLQSELALREPTVPAALEPKLRHLVELASAIKAQLRPVA
jgi:hypothetical protein